MNESPAHRAKERQRCQGNRRKVDSQGKRNVPPDGTGRRTREVYQPGQRAQCIGDQHDVRGFSGEIASYAPHGHPDGGRTQSGSIIDAIANHDNRGVFLDVSQFIFGKTSGPNIPNPQRLCHTGRGGGVVPCQQTGFQPLFPKCPKRPFAFRTKRVGKSDLTQSLSIEQDLRHRLEPRGLMRRTPHTYTLSGNNAFNTFAWFYPHVGGFEEFKTFRLSFRNNGLGQRMFAMALHGGCHTEQMFRCDTGNRPYRGNHWLTEG